MAAKTPGVYLARFRFLESVGYKIRPVIVLTAPRGLYNTVIVVPVSSQLTLEDVDVLINDWQDLGLKQPSVARLHRLTAVMGDNILEEIGQLSTSDTQTIHASLRGLLHL